MVVYLKKNHTELSRIRVNSEHHSPVTLSKFIRPNDYNIREIELCAKFMRCCTRDVTHNTKKFAIWSSPYSYAYAPWLTSGFLH